jgi:hypothetical protein
VSYDGPDDNASAEPHRDYRQFPVTGEELLVRMIARRTGNSPPESVPAEVLAELIGYTSGLLAFGHLTRHTADRLLEPFIGPNYFSSGTVTRRIEGSSEPENGGWAAGGPEPATTNSDPLMPLIGMAA